MKKSTIVMIVISCIAVITIIVLCIWNYFASQNAKIIQSYSDAVQNFESQETYGFVYTSDSDGETSQMEFTKSNGITKVVYTHGEASRTVYKTSDDTIYVLNNDTQMVSVSTEEIDKKMTNLGIFFIYFSPWFTSIHEETVNDVRCYVLQNVDCKMYIQAETYLPIQCEEGSVGKITYTDSTTITPLSLPAIATE